VLATINGAALAQSSRIAGLTTWTYRLNPFAGFRLAGADHTGTVVASLENKARAAPGQLTLNQSDHLKTYLITIVVSLISCLSLRAGGADEKAFTKKYRTALEAKDTATLESFLYTQGADPQIVEFYKMMQSSGAGGKIAKIELAALTADEAAKALAPQESPTGGKICLTLKPTKKLVITTEQKSSEGSSSSTSTNFIAEKDGKFVIPVPGPCK
jgi:hypothetical protein